MFLPSVWQEIADPVAFLTHLTLKAGMTATHFSPGFTAQRFRSIEVKGRMRDHPPTAVLPTAAARAGWTPLPRAG